MMRNRPLIVWGLAVLLVVGLSPLAAAVSDVSFRMIGMGRGLAGIVNDEYTDFNLFPALVVDTTGTTLFTNLGNLGNPVRTLRQSGTEAEYGYPNATNVLGLITDFADGKGGFIAQSGSFSGTYEGNESGTWSGEVPGNLQAPSLLGDGSSTDVHRDKVTEKTSSSQGDYSLFYGRTLDSGAKVGFRLGTARWSYSHLDEGSEYETWGGGHYWEKHTWHEEYRDDSSHTRLEAGGQMAAGDWIVDGVLRYAPETAEVKSPDQHLWEDGCGWLTETDTEDEQVTTKIALNTFALKARASRPFSVFGKDSVGRLFGGFSTGSGDYEGSANVKAVETDDWSTSTLKDVTTETNLASRSMKGDATRSDYEVGAGAQVALGEATTLGLGLRLSGAKTKNVNDVTGEVDERVVEHIGGTKAQPVITTDSTKTERNDPYTITSEGETFRVSVPVGLEHRLTDRLTLRLGSEAILVNRTKNTNTADRTDAPDTINGHLQQGATTTWTDSGSEEDNRTSVIYTAGFGYQLSENVQLDVVHVNNLVNIQNWLMSVSIKF